MVAQECYSGSVPSDVVHTSIFDMNTFLIREVIRPLCYKPENGGSIPDEVIEFFSLRNPSSRTVALGSTQPPTEMSTSKNRAL
jgi:hypothetical protein